MEAEHFSDERIFDSDADTGDEESCNEEQTMGQEPTKCLFCDDSEASVEEAIQHLSHRHSVNLSSIKQKFNLDQYSYVKMINYIKTHKVTAEHLLGFDKVLWNDEKYMKPVEEDDLPWLTYDIDYVKECKLNSGIIFSETNEKNDEKNKIDGLIEQLEEKNVLIEQLLEQIHSMRMGFHAWIDRSTDCPTAEKSLRAEQTHVAKIPISQDESYFQTYAHFGIHYDMLSDAVRTNSYREAILQNRPLFKDKNVLDVGCGSGILSLFSSEAGANKIFAVDHSEIIYCAIEIALRNNIKNVEFLKGRLENMSIPLAAGQSIDIIVSEWMGYFLLFEGMLDSVIHARDKYLKPGGLLLPNRCTINLVGYADEVRHTEYINFWKSVYGYDMSVLQTKVLQEAVVETCRSEHVLTEAVVIADYNLLLVNYDYPNFKCDFVLKIKKTGKFTAFVGFFDTFFDLPQNVAFSTAPHASPTHWKQVIFYLKTPLAVNEGDNICGLFQCSRDKTDARAIRIKIFAFDQELTFNLN